VNLSLGLMVLLAGLALLACFRRGAASGRRALVDTADGLKRILPLILLALPMAGFIAEIIPADWASDWLGPESGATGIAIATLAGGLLPGGPFVAFPLALAFLKAGAGPAQMVALISGWSVLALHRTITWEMTVLGGRFVALRLLASFPLPFLAGLLAEALLPFFPGAALR